MSEDGDFMALVEWVAGMLEFLGEKQLKNEPKLAALKPYLGKYKTLIGFPPEIAAPDMIYTLMRHQMPTAIHDHLPTLFMLTKELHLARVLELGVEFGNSTVALLEAVSKIDGHVWSIDLTPCLETKALVQECGLGKYWTFIQGDDLEVSWNAPIDHLFIDTLHLTKQTSAELAKFEPFVTEGGIITLHDTYSFPGVSRGVRSYFKGRDDVALYEYRNNHGFIVVRKQKSIRSSCG